MNRWLIEVRALLYKEFLLEWRERYAINGLLLYIFTAVFIITLSYKGKISPMGWNISFWVTNLFVAIQAIGRSFISETEGQNLYLYQLAAPTALILAKMLYNCLLMLGALLVSGIAFLVLGGSPFSELLYFFISLPIAALALGCGLTLISAIAAQSNNKTALMAVLGFPVLIPQLLALIRLTEGAIVDVLRTKEILFLSAMTGIVACLSFLLFPFIWRE